MLDTTLCIRILRDRPPSLRPRFNAEADGLCLSTIVLTELLHGAAKSARPIENRQEVERFTARLETLAFDANAAWHAADIRAVLEHHPSNLLSCSDKDARQNKELEIFSDPLRSEKAPERSGQPIGGYDLLIAGHARSRGLVVVTANLGEFTRVEGLRAEDWLVP